MTSNVRSALFRDGDMLIGQVAELVKRSYTWVYMRVCNDLAKKDAYTYKGAIYIRKGGVDKIAGMSLRAPKVGRPRKPR